MAFLCNAFNDPSNPWYYVIGVVFLLVIFGALAAYIILTGKKNKGKEEEKPTADQPTDADSATDNTDAQSATEPTEQKDEDKTE